MQIHTHTHSHRNHSLSMGLLERAEKVRYMTYTLITPGCNRPDMG